MPRSKTFHLDLRHTPGPWTYEGTGSLVGSPDRLRVADVYTPEITPEERQANARLIAAAPTRRCAS
jgi:hypothetical protein